MTERLSWQEITVKYPDEWVLLEDCVVEHGQVKEGILAFHSEDKEKVFAYPSDSDSIGLFYTGESHFRGFRSHAEHHTI